MARIIVDHLKNLTQSIIYFMKNEELIKDGVSKTLRQWLIDEGDISDLSIVVGFPPALDQLALPALALVETSMLPIQELVFNESAKEQIVGYTLFGFAGGFAEDSKNLRLRDQLLNDLKIMFEDTEFIDVHTLAPNGDLDAATTVSAAVIQNVSARTIPATGLLPADRFRFAIDFEMGVLRALDA